jgi:hypothetical protein
VGGTQRDCGNVCVGGGAGGGGDGKGAVKVVVGGRVSEGDGEGFTGR